MKDLALLVIENFGVKEGKFKEFQDWVKKSKTDLVELGKKAGGWKFQGAYYYALGTGASIGADGCFMWEISKYADFDSSRGTFKDPLDEKISKALVELLVNEPMPMVILRPQSEALIYKGM